MKRKTYQKPTFQMVKMLKEEILKISSQGSWQSQIYGYYQPDWYED